jgi:hypothetical protein
MTDPAEARRSGRVLRIAVIGSVLVHLFCFLLYAVVTERIPSLRKLLASATPPPDVVVTTSQSIRIEKRAHPVPVPRPRPKTQPAVRQPNAPTRASVAVQPHQLVAPTIPKPQLNPPLPHALHELAKAAPKAPPNPPKTVKATEPPHPVPTQAATAEPRRVALVQPNSPAHRAVPANRAQLSQAELAHIGADLQKTVEELHAESNPLAVRSTSPPSANKRYHVQMSAFAGELRGAQGTCYPIKSWVVGSYDYYYETCDVQFDDGRFQAQPVPWPIRYARGHDLYHGDLGATTVPLPPPQPGWKLPPGEPVSDELRRYAHDNGVDI